MGNNRKFRHHTVPASYLTNFAKNAKQVAVANLKTQKTYLSSVSDASVNKGFYAISAEVQAALEIEESVFEDWLGDEIEGPAKPVFNKILDGGWPLNFEDRKILAQFIVIQLLRVPAQREFLNQIMSSFFMGKVKALGKNYLRNELIGQFGKEFCENNLDYIWTSSLNGELKVEHDSIHHISAILESSNKHMPYIMGRKWCIVNFQDNNLITCDNPVALQKPAPEIVEIEGQRYIMSGSGAGVTNAPVIYFPISRNVGLCLLEVWQYPRYTMKDMVEGIHDIYLPETEELYTDFYNAILRNAKQQIFCHPDDIAILPILPPTESISR